MVGAPNIFLCQRWQVKRREEWKSDLAAVRVPGKLQVDGKFCRSIGEVWFMGEQNYSFSGGDAVHGLRQVGGSAHYIVHTGQPETRAVLLDGLRLVGQHLDVLGLESAGYMFGIGAVIMVSQDSPEAVRRGQLAQEARAGLGGERSLRRVADRGHGDEVSSERDQVRMKIVHHGNRSAQGMNREIRIVVEIAEHGDGEAIQPFGPALKAKLLPHNARKVRSEKDSVSDDRDCADGGSPVKKLASCGGDQRQTRITR